MSGGQSWQQIYQLPITGLFVTLLAYKLALLIHCRCRQHPLTNPVLLGVLLVLGYLLLTGSTYQQYMQGGQLIQQLLGPATVALAVPLYHNLTRLKQAAGAVLFSIVLGGVCGIVSAVGLGYLFDLPQQVLLSLSTRSVTTPIAMSVAQSIGALPQLSVLFVMVSGVFGAVIVKPLFHRLRLDEDRVIGVATGIAAHGIGTARVFQLSETAGAFASLAMSLNGVLTALLVPLLFALWSF
ncbi:LrgB family protein [Neisseriaceae bacterium TC5R-5]|nr:LrgB family protein [Neisseriaceae bacterium TC5R-5]